MADQLVERGLRVTILEKAPHIMPLLASDLANALQLHLQTRNVTIVTSDGVSGFEEIQREGESDEKSLLVLTEQGRKLSADVVIFSIGLILCFVCSFVVTY
jgi:NADPH-dependent 2,4-dienoyl-CoA reductase/sulfur reductase-like enzyme